LALSGIYLRKETRGGARLGLGTGRERRNILLQLEVTNERKKQVKKKTAQGETGPVSCEGFLQAIEQGKKGPSAVFKKEECQIKSLRVRSKTWTRKGPSRGWGQ